MKVATSAPKNIVILSSTSNILKISAHRVNELTLSIFALIKISNKYQ